MLAGSVKVIEVLAARVAVPMTVLGVVAVSSVSRLGDWAKTVRKPGVPGACGQYDALATPAPLLVDVVVVVLPDG
jgi:hypothetical protein